MESSFTLFWHLKVNHLVSDPPSSDLRTSPLDTLCFWGRAGLNGRWGSSRREWMEGEGGSMRIECIMEWDWQGWEAKNLRVFHALSSLFNWKHDALPNTEEPSYLKGYQCSFWLLYFSFILNLVIMIYISVSDFSLLICWLNTFYSMLNILHYKCVALKATAVFFFFVLSYHGYSPVVQYLSKKWFDKDTQHM